MPSLGPPNIGPQMRKGAEHRVPIAVIRGQFAMSREHDRACLLGIDPDASVLPGMLDVNPRQ